MKLCLLTQFFSKFDNTIIFIRNITNAYYIIIKKMLSQ